ncbi:D-inositol-3-phosphate glycosyltransferase [Nocardioides zeae]|uniref:D-inositol-3-phosphate glycosyltransferase n=1 Tax=Nocardioides imazamoxiresistens TaxID=3231893 RepID=A0ABU3PY31_9ACTN|nr:D-inositol-3-phosphate glycosyltransferase [Nocardioides zeae]MDT9594152.1 D-inositol-3-phosphate glycosyltransferase [Nocardioides zeae]
MISLHTSPLDQPGTGDAGGMNVYVLELARRIGGLGVAVDVMTRATSSRNAPVVEVAENVRVSHLVAGPYEGIDKADLPAQLCTFAREVLRTGAEAPLGHFDAVHSHYWLSGQVGALARDRWGVPLVHSMHTMAKVKNAALATGDEPEPAVRVIGEEQVVDAADLLVANTDREADELVSLYGAPPDRVRVIHPGVDLSRFRPQHRGSVRAALGLPADARVVLFAGRIQPLKAPDVLVRAVAALLERDPGLRPRLVVPVVGGPSGSGRERPDALADLVTSLGLDDVVRFVPPVTQAELAWWYAAADLVAVPSYNESFGLVALEAQAAGTPVLAAGVGGLVTAVDDGVSGMLVDTHEPSDWAAALRRLLRDDDLRLSLSAGALAHARGFAWERCAEVTLEAYEHAARSMRVGADR